MTDWLSQWNRELYTLFFIKLSRNYTKISIAKGYWNKVQKEKGMQISESTNAPG